MARWRVQDQAWREGSHGGNEVVMSKRLVWRCFGGNVLLERCNCAQNSCIILATSLALGKRVLVHIWWARHFGGAKEAILSLY